MNKEKLTQKELKKVLKYDIHTGLFKWIRLMGTNKIKIGSIAGSKRSDGYIHMSIYSKLYSAHRLAWLYMEGYMPENDIDHINRVRDDNRWFNLRHVSRTCNLRNSKVQKRNKLGITGVYSNKQNKKISAQIRVNKKRINLGSFKSLTKAVYHRWKAECKYNWANCNSTSSAYLYLKEKGLIK